jgi:DNA-binding LacI/PurR family transcriptional regulator
VQFEASVKSTLLAGDNEHRQPAGLREPPISFSSVLRASCMPDPTDSIQVPSSGTGAAAKTAGLVTSALSDARLQMADIARLAGVSTSTVSRALSNSPLVNAKTRKRIEELASSLNYSVNVGAQSLRLRENRTVSVVVPYGRDSRQSLSDPFFLSILGSVANALTEHGMEMLLSRVNEDQLDSVSQIFASNRAVGVIIIGQWHHHQLLNQLAARNLPVVVWGAQLSNQLYRSVGSDNFSGGLQAATHLLKLGRRRIAFFGDTDLPEVAMRHAGYLQAHRDMNLVPDPALTIAMPFAAQLAQTAVTAFLDESGLKFDGVFAASDLLAMTTISALGKRGWRIPADVAVVGYDDIELAAHFHPTLTTVRQPVDLAGETLVDLLMKLIAGVDVSSASLPTVLQIRESTTGH